MQIVGFMVAKMRFTATSTARHVLMHFFIFCSFKVYIIALKAHTLCNVKPYISQREVILHNDVEFVTLIAGQTVAFRRYPIRLYITFNLYVL